MDTKLSVLYHVSVLFIPSLGVFALKRFNMIILLFMIPVLGEAVQFFMPGRTPDFMDIFHGYLGILAGYCCIRLWKELRPSMKKVLFQVNLAEKLRRAAK